jgi:hypothetical protein
MNPFFGALALVEGELRIGDHVRVLNNRVFRA